MKQSQRLNPSANIALRHLHVHRGSNLSPPHRGWISCGGWRARCAIGRTGATFKKREGDGATPIGAFAIRLWFFSAKENGAFRGGRNWRFATPHDGWCDDPASGAYNRRVRLPYRASCESLWRADGKYAVIGVMDYNLQPRRKGAGSAIFFHICDEDYGPTAGCVALPAQEMRKLLPRLGRRIIIHVH